MMAVSLVSVSAPPVASLSMLSGRVGGGRGLLSAGGIGRAPHPPSLHTTFLSSSSVSFRSSSLSASTSDSTSEPDDFDSAPGPYELQPPSLKIEKRQKAALLRDSRSKTIQLPDPSNFEVGWKRTKPIDTRKPRGFVVADFIMKLELLMGRGQFGSVELLVKASGIVVERAREETEVIMARSEEEGEGVDERVVTELFRVFRLLEMDLQMLKVAVKEETRMERIEQARARCRQAIQIALNL